MKEGGQDRSRSSPHSDVTKQRRKKQVAASRLQGNILAASRLQGNILAASRHQGNSTRGVAGGSRKKMCARAARARSNRKKDGKPQLLPPAHNRCARRAMAVRVVASWAQGMSNEPEADVGTMKLNRTRCPCPAPSRHCPYGYRVAFSAASRREPPKRGFSGVFPQAQVYRPPLRRPPAPARPALRRPPAPARPALGRFPAAARMRPCYSKATTLTLPCSSKATTRTLPCCCSDAPLLLLRRSPVAARPCPCCCSDASLLLLGRAPAAARPCPCC